MKAWINGRLLEEDQAAVSIFDRSYLYGEGIFETLMAYRGRPAFLSRHHKRFHDNCRKLNLAFPFSEKNLEEAIHHLLETNNLKKAVVRLTFSQVGAAFGVKRPENLPNNLSIFCRAIEIDPKFFEEGVRVLPLATLTNDPLQTAGIKSTSYLVKMLARAEAGIAGAYESLLKNSAGNWVEGSRTNLFIVLDHCVITAPLSEGLLPGVTRDVVLEILRNEKIPHKESPITDVMLKAADEIFLTGSTSEVMPVCEVVGMWKKKAAAGALAKKLLGIYRKLVDSF